MTPSIDWLAARTLASPDQLALITSHQQLTYAQLNKSVDAATRYFKRGQHIGLLFENNATYVILMFAAMRVGAVIVPLNTRLTIEEIQWQLHNTACDTLLASPTQAARLPYRQPTDPAEVVMFYLPMVDKQFKAVARTLDEPTPRHMNNPFVIVHTSGTSGKPKGAVLSYANLYQSAMASAYRIGHLPHDVWLCVLPLYHVGGLSIIMRACLYGITVDLRSFDVDTINHALTNENITLISLVPTMLYRLLQARDELWSDSLRLVLLGGAATTPQLMQQCIDLDIPVATTYGLSEASSQVATTLPGIAAHKPGTVGKALMFTEIQIIDEVGNPQPIGEYGEIIVRSPTVMLGYYRNPEATRHTIQNGWLYTGDIGYLDADGDLFLVQRRSDLIVSGGENIYPAEVEAVLRQHPAIAEVAVVGLPHPEWGQQVAAAIVTSHPISTDELTTFARQQLAGYKVPRQWQFVATLPQTASGKIQRAGVVALFETP